MNRKYVRVAIDGLAISIDRLYDYFVPKTIKTPILPGCRVTVPFGRSNKKSQAVVMELPETCENGEILIKPIHEVLDEHPVIGDESLKLITWMKDKYFCSHYDVVRSLLPVGINLRTTITYSINPEYKEHPDLLMVDQKYQQVFDFLTTQKKGVKCQTLLKMCSHETISEMVSKNIIVADEQLKQHIKHNSAKMASLIIDTDEAQQMSERLKTRFPKQSSVLQMLINNGTCAVKDVCYMTGVTPAVISTLEKKRVVALHETIVYRNIYNDRETDPAAITGDIELTPEQSDVFDGLNDMMSKGIPETSLLFGVTGSGKTSIFLKLVDEAISRNKTAIVLVPEISLTTQLLNIFYSRYKNKIAMLHSGLSLGERMDEWQRIKNGDALVVLGTRSAIFAPVINLGVIIIDEQQENTYKSEMAPRYDTLSIAQFRCNYHKSLLLLASATPDITAYYRAKTNKYKLFTLKNRYNNMPLPEVSIVDMCRDLQNGNKTSISFQLQNEIISALNKKKQIILFYNRRGYNTFLSCRSCGNVTMCPNCSIALTYHFTNKRLMCHYCGYSQETLTICSECGSPHIKYFGTGIQKIEQDLETMFPDAKILRMDADTTHTKLSHEQIFNKFREKNYDILIGTQMVTKGFDFPNVTLVGVIMADMSLYLDSYTANERTFSLLTQVIGRCGRGDSEGKAVIQTYSPNHSVIRQAVKQDYNSFYNGEIVLRKA